MNSSQENNFSGLSALYLNCTLKPSPKHSHTQDLMNKSANILKENGVSTEMLRVADYDVPPGMSPDMTEQEFEKDEWPQIQQKVLGADILVIGSPIWLGQKSAICKKVIERLYASSGKLNDKNQSIYYNRVGGSVITGNEDGYKHNNSYILYSLMHMGYTVPPQCSTGWVGEAGPGKSYGDESDSGPIGYDNKFTKQTTKIMSWNLMHFTRTIKDVGGIPTKGNQRSNG